MMIQHYCTAFLRFSASPLRQLAKDDTLVESWPPTMIIHGMLDGIVPVEHSLSFLSSLVVGGSHLSALRNLRHESSCNTNTAALNETSRNLNSKKSKKHDDKGVGTTNSSNFEENGDKKLSKELRKRDEDEKMIPEEIVHPCEKTVTPPYRDTMWAMREQDAMVTLPGAKHSFEAVGGEVVDVVSEGVINWLSRVK
jgi:hypothetical protein